MSKPESNYTETRQRQIKEFFEMMLVNAGNTLAVKGSLAELLKDLEVDIKSNTK